MSNVTRYLQEAQRSANSRYLNFTGSNPSQPFYSADGSGMGMQAPQSSPYAITISNTGVQTTINLFGAWTYLNPPANFTWSAGDLVYSSGNTGYTISGAFSNVTYQYLLNQSNLAPFSIGATQIVANTVNAQVNQPITVSTTDANGDQLSKIITFLVNPFQNQSGTLINNTQFRIDGSTTLTTTLLAGSVTTLYLFPMMNVDPARPLVGAPQAQQFGNPNLQPANTVVIPASAGGATIVNRLRS